MTITFAIIPARGGSVRVPRKNARLLGGKPLIAWTIEAAQGAGLDGIFVSSDDGEIKSQATAAGAGVITRPSQYASAESPDIEWLQHALAWLRARELAPDVLAILRPTSPFRDADCIRLALRAYMEAGSRVDSLRAVRPALEHPAKTWLWAPGLGPNIMRPALIGANDGTPWHSCQTNTLPTPLVQTGGMEIVRRTVVEQGSLAGALVMGFVLEGPAALDINTEADWAEAERHVAGDPAVYDLTQLGPGEPPPARTASPTRRRR